VTGDTTESSAIEEAGKLEALNVDAGETSESAQPPEPAAETEPPPPSGDEPATEQAEEETPSPVDSGPAEPPDDSGPDEGERLEEAQRLLARQSDLVDRLHAENQTLRAGELRNAQLPLIRDLLRLHDDVGRMREACESDHDLRLVQEGLADALARNGVESYAPDSGEGFDPRLHAAAGVESTAEESLDRTVAEVTRQGFRWESGDTIRVAEVRAYRYRST
jgi:molecular chaperone GrpE (heat shock protein)